MVTNRIGSAMRRDLYIIVIDTICKQCGFRNKGSYRLEEEMDIVCCGKCACFITTPDDITEEDRKSVQKCVKEAIEDEKKDTNIIDM